MISRHLASLCRAGVVRREKVGRHVFFAVDGPGVLDGGDEDHPLGEDEGRHEGADAQLFPSTPGYWWNWDSNASREHYRALRNQSKMAYRRSLFLVGAAVVNRLLSAIDAYRSASAFDRNREFGAADWGIYYAADGPLWNSKLEVGFVKRF